MVGNEEGSDRLRRYLRAASRLATELTGRLELEALLGLVVETLTRDFDAALARIWLLDPAGEALELRASAGLSTRTRESPRARIRVAAPCKMAEVARSRTPFVKNGLAGEAPFEQDWVADERLAAVAVHPLVASDRLVGVMVHFSRVPLSDEVVLVLATVAATGAAAIARRQAEAELHEVREASARLIETANAIFLATDREGRIVHVNPFGLELAGVALEEVKGKVWYDTPYVASRDGSLRLWDTLLRDGAANAENPILTKRGEVRHVAWNCSLVRDEKGAVALTIGLGIDVTERRRSEEAIRAAEERLKTVVAHAPVVLFALDAKGVFTLSEGRGLAALGLRPGEVVGLSVFDLYEPDGEVAEACRRALSGESFTSIVDAGERHYETHYTPVLDAAGKPAGTVGVSVDVTERHRAERALLAETERLTVTLRSIGDGVIATDVSGAVVLLNGVAEELTSWSQDAARGRPLEEVFRIVDERTGAPRANPAATVLATGNTVGLENGTVLVSRKGERRIISDSAAPIRDASGAVLGVVLVFRDVTERYRIQDELQKIAKLESVGLLAAGIAHDFNNLLMTISANTALARVALPPENRAVALLSEVEGATHQARRLTHQLLTFSKGGAPVRVRSQLGPLVREAANLACAGATSLCTVSLPAELWPVEVDVGQFGQVVHNLVLNAQQAMPRGGTIRIHGENVTLAENEEWGLPLPPGRYVHLAVEDRGDGIPPDVLPKVFDPFFTTKPGGTGLGLATTFSIVRNHGGHVTCRSEPSVGTTFHVWLPASDGPLAVAPPTPPRALPRGAGRVLVMDDQASVRNVVGRMLVHLGYEPAFARDGEEAIDLYRRALEEGRRFDSVIMDLTIPGGMGGREAIGHIRALDPEVHAIVSSGYSNDPVMADHARYGFRGLLPKPFQVEELARVLARRRAAPPA